MAFLGNVKTWMKTWFPFNRDQTQPSEENQPVFIPAEEKENIIDFDQDRSGHSGEDLLGVIMPEETKETSPTSQTPAMGMASAYLVDNESVIVQPDETLGHYADWLGVSTWTLRRLNHLSYYQQIQVGQRIELRFDTVSVEQFEERRTAYHQEIRKQFFEKYRVDRSITHTVGRGETLWTLAMYQYDVPLWLLMAYNHDKNLNQVRPGEIMTIPVVKEVHFSSNGTT